MPEITLTVPHIALEKLFHPFIGVTPKPGIVQLRLPVQGVVCKRYWMTSFGEPGRVWANPEHAEADRRWIRYVREGVGDDDKTSQREFLKEPEWRHRALFDLPKLMIGNSTNRNAKFPLPVSIDTEGLCPNKDIYCISTTRASIKAGLPAPPKSPNLSFWGALSDEDQLLWLVGILSSNLANELSLVNRSVRHWTLEALRHFPLPTDFDPEVIEIARSMVERDRCCEPIPSPDPLRQELNSRIEAVYGYPRRLNFSRTQETAALNAWSAERDKPSRLITGQVLEVIDTDADSRVRVYLDGLIDEESEAEIPLPQEMPGWALNGCMFSAELSTDVRTFGHLQERPWAMRRFRHSPRPYLTADELVFHFKE
jgi:hypothetical protein